MMGIFVILGIGFFFGYLFGYMFGYRHCNLKCMQEIRELYGKKEESK